MTKLCWNGIVRNEAARIERCMAALVPHISSYAITDTGSTDGTPKIIKSFFKMNGIPGRVTRAPFHNWAQARNAALVHGADSLFRSDYFLLCDADMELVVTDPKWADNLGGLSYDMMQHAGGLVYGNRRLLASAYPGKYLGVTHEYLDVPAAGLLQGAYFVDHADGSNRADKFTRDIELLEAGVKQEPQNGRYWFYLAQSYRDSGRDELAAKAYKRRVEIGGWDEEVWNAQLCIAHCLKNQGDEAGFIREALVAYNMRPSRAEALYDVAKHYREKGMNAASTLFSEAGMQLPMSTDLLFVSSDVYKHSLREEYAITAFYDPKKRSRGFDVCDGLAVDASVPAWVRSQARSNLFHYVQPLSVNVPCTAHHLPFVPPDGYVAMNPSIMTKEGGLHNRDEIWAIVRTVNYDITPTGAYAIKGGDGSINDSNPINTRNFLLELERDFTIKSQVEINWYRPSPAFPLVIGLEDMRLFQGPEKDKFRFITNIREQNPEGWCTQCIGLLDPSGEVDYWQQMQAPAPRQHEKNWMPLAQASQYMAPKFVYRLGHVIGLDGKTLYQHKSPYDVGQVNGGSQVILFNAGYLAVVHEAFFRPDGQRYYVHRFASMDTHFRLIKLSRPFVFFDRQIEFCAGLAWHPDRMRLMLSIGVKDKEAWVLTVKSSDLLELLV